MITRPGAPKPLTAAELYRKLSLFTRLTHKRAITASYRALVLGVDHVRACGLFGRMDSTINLGLGAEAYVNCDDFLQLLRSLPDREFKARLADGALHWTCGAAKGHLSLMSDKDIEVPSPEFSAAPDEGGVINSDYGAGLELGALAVGREDGLRALGLQGVQIRNAANGKVYAYATDNTTVSSCCLGPAPEPDNDTVITLLPEAVDLLAALLKREGEAILAHDDSSVYCVTDNMRLLLHQVPPLTVDVAKIMSGYAKADVTMPLYRGAVAAFLKRAEALSETVHHAKVEISVEDGRTRLVFNEASSSSEEYYLVEDGPRITVPPVRLEANTLAKALGHADVLVFDYAKKNVLKLQGDNEFVFAVTGRRE